jgi:hypothetical protein
MLRTRLNVRIAIDYTHAQAVCVAEEVIDRDEVVALLFNVSDIAASLDRIRLLLEGSDGEEETDEG